MSTLRLKQQKSIVITPRKLEIIRLRRRGVSVSRIAQELGLNYHTVRDHTRLLRRTGLLSQNAIIPRLGAVVQLTSAG